MTSLRGVSGVDLARMQTNSNEHADVNAHVYRRSPTSDARGGTTSTLALVGTYRVRKAPLTTVQSAEQVYADRLGGNQGWWFTFPRFADVRMDDRIESSSRTYEVVSMDEDRSEPISTRVLCRELT